MEALGVARLAGGVLALVGAALVLPALLAAVSGESWLCFAAPAAVGLAAGGAVLFATRATPPSLDARGALAAPAPLLVLAALLGAAPFALSPELELSAVDALYESTAAFSTSGASLLAGRAEVPGAVVFWRSLASWLGGLGAILLGVAVLPALGVAGLPFEPRALPGVASDRLPARAFEAARVCVPLWLGLTAASALLFAVAGMGPLDALAAAMACLSTGALLLPAGTLTGFASVAAIATLLAGALGARLAFRAVSGALAWSGEPELRALVGLFALASALVALDVVLATGAPAAAALEDAALRTAAMLSTTGVPVESERELPPLSRVVLGLLLVLGGTTGSASGGLRLGRVLLLVRVASAHFFRLVHPRGFQLLRLGGRGVDEGVVEGLAGFLVLWVAALAVGSALLAAHGLDLGASFAAAAAALANSDAGWTGGADRVAALAPTGKLVLAFLMLLGRLEIYCVVVLLAAGLWRR